MCTMASKLGDVKAVQSSSTNPLRYMYIRCLPGRAPLGTWRTACIHMKYGVGTAGARATSRVEFEFWGMHKATTALIALL